jgi:hypothetical protein
LFEARELNERSRAAFLRQKAAAHDVFVILPNKCSSWGAGKANRCGNLSCLAIKHRPRQKAASRKGGCRVRHQALRRPRDKGA